MKIFFIVSILALVLCASTSAAIPQNNGCHGLDSCVYTGKGK